MLVAYRLFGITGLYATTIIATILAGIEVLMLIDGFGMKQTLGNVMFASTYLITDILRENEGKKSATRTVWLGVFASVITLIFTQYWLFYNSAKSAWARPHIETIFSITPRMLLASFLGYVIFLCFDVWLYRTLPQRNGGQRSLFMAS